MKWLGVGVALALALGGRAEVPRHVFSMSFKVTSLNGELTRPGLKERTAAWMKSHHISKVWLETYRHAEYVPTERLVAYRDWFRTNGFEVCGLLTPTMLNDPATPGEKPAYCCCWSDPKCRRRLADEAVRSTGIFDTVLLDDFLFDTCSCPRCTKLMEDSGKSREAFRFDHMTDLCRRAIYEPAHAKNPGSRFIVKFQCWFEQWPRTGLDPKRLTDVFGACWIGTESRDNCKDPLQSATITPWVNGLTGGRCEGCWFDPLDSTPERYVQQARYTVLGGTRETLFHAYDYLIAEEPGAVPFGQSPKGGHACLKALDAEIDGLWQLAETVGTLDPVEQRLGPDGVSRHLFRKGDTIYTAFQNTTDAARSVGCPKGARIVLALPDASAFDAARGELKAHGLVLFAGEGGSATARADRPWVSGEEKAKTRNPVVGIETMPGTPETDTTVFWLDEAKTKCLRINYDESKAGVLGKDYTLEDPLSFVDGRKVRNAADWAARRREILHILEQNEYGVMPPPPPTNRVELVSEKLMDSRFAYERRYRQTFRADGTGPAVDWLMYVPVHAKERVPVIVGLNYRTINRIAETLSDDHYRIPIDAIIARGYAYMTADYQQFTADPKDNAEFAAKVYDGVYELWGWRDPKRKDLTGALMTWAWGLCRGLDLAAQAAAPVWKFLTGRTFDARTLPEAYSDAHVKPPFGYATRTECHGLAPYDWLWALDFADRALGKRP